MAPAVVGVGGLQTNVSPPKRSLYQRLFRRGRPGEVLKCGVGLGVFRAEGPVDVDWLPGCSMSYRAAIFEHIEFDESLPGYGMGEDVDFSYRASVLGSLVVDPGATVLHLSSPVNRLGQRDVRLAEWENRAKRVCRGCRQYSRTWYLADLAGWSLFALVARAKRRHEAPTINELVRIILRCVPRVMGRGSS
jgi:GT2 family glycosyltransferase